MPFVTSRRPSIQYDGSNGATIAGVWCTGIRLLSDTGSVLKYKDRDNREQRANLGDWFIIAAADDGYPTVLPPADYERDFIEIPVAGA